MADDGAIKYDMFNSPKVALDRSHYERVIATKGSRAPVYERVLAPETGDAFFVGAGQVIRLEQRHDTTQITDWWWFSADLRHRQVGSNSVFWEGQFLTTYKRIWSDIRNMRPMATMVADEVPEDFTPPRWKEHFWGYHCSPTWHQAGYPHLPASQNACHVNAMHGINRIPAVQAIADEQERRDTVHRMASIANYQTFQPIAVTIDDEGDMVFHAAPAPSVPPGTGVEFYAEMDAWVIISSCPWVDQSGAVGDMEPVPVYVSVWDTGIPPLAPPTWMDWEAALYAAIDSGEKDISPRHPESYGHEDSIASR